MPHSSVPGITIQVPNPQLRVLFAVVSSMCVYLQKWNALAGKCGVRSNLQQGLLCPAVPAVLGCQAGILDQPVVGLLAKTSRCPAVGVVAGPGILLPQQGQGGVGC